MDLNKKLAHLPIEKIVQITEAIDLILRKVPNSSKIILYGSYASGNWVQDKKSFDGLEYEYVSDFDILIIVPFTEEKEFVLEDKIVNGWKYPTFLAPDVRSIEYVNAELRKGNYFFEEVLRKGITLFDDGMAVLEEALNQKEKDRSGFALTYFEKCMDNAEQFEIAAESAISNFKYSIATFMLHQAAENYYSAILLVFTGYKPKIHNLKFLRERTKEYSDTLYFLFKPHENNPIESRLFSLLKRGYVEARYHPVFDVTKEEIDELAKRIKTMRKLVILTSREKLKEI
ncbi:HEPN domain-containing protein [Algoriphagus sp.]|uniref:HEPN domain-containing protein n=1 Tax=Algoriphagus sp. TaxID=1872435 RepID=UPI003F726747